MPFLLNLVSEFMPLIPTLPVKPGYRPQAEDTSIEADVFYFAALRQKSQLWRMERFITFNQSTRQLCLSAINNQCPAALMRLEYLRRRLGQAWCQFGSPDEVALEQIDQAVSVLSLEGEVVVADPIALARKIITILESLSIEYYIGGSVASSLLGESRYTEDLDLIIELDPVKAQPLLAAFLDAAFYISDSAIEDAVSGRCSSFNVLDNETLEKADLFVLQDTAFARSKMERRIQHSLADGSSLWISSPEDIVLQKLVWGRGSQSEKQWRDVLGVLKLQGDRLDFDYLWHWSVELGISEALDQAFREAGL
jgi:hypothetical protein